MSATKCPIFATIAHIRGGLDFDKTNSKNTIKTSSITIVCENVAYHISTRQMTLARFKMSHPDLTQCRSTYLKLFGGLANKSYSTIFMDLANIMLHGSTLVDSYISAVNSLDNLDNMAASTSAVNMSLPPPVPSIENISDLIYDPSLLHACINELANYLNTFQLPGKTTAVGLFHAPPPTPPKFEKKMPPPPTLPTPEDYLNLMDHLMSEELTILHYLAEIELYHCQAISYLSTLQSECRKLSTTH